ncbi:threonine ammonia-lyase [Alphaproteobacteria bacterium]|jgi:threonine dehydratase|nr:threonine ammonia-lyase [Alphaproteobacteria bacterium]MDA8943313.1 threonine ammonia-lyase [Alphaproteobacteria bacterium]MDA9012641.1 threonine ammonia-lyase [Alphaproteobacteria bacterium]MDA9055858.1 threonine ammonia-lyase [Alphaproteobacteria bacterium]MDA9132634.1 threonine ammonia-lyase [Alphaproteobacteria bacterium]
MAVTADQIRDTAIRLDGQIIRTPMLEAPMLSRNLGCDLFLKLECLQHTSSFKARGALNAMLGLNDEQRRLGVIAMSAGNHAQAVAYHAEHMGIPATIVMPAQTPFAKVARTRAFGAKVVLEGRNLNECEGTVNALIQEHGLTLIHPYDNELVMMGQGTAGLEMLTDQPDLDILIVPIGGGGLMGGIATIARDMRPNIKIYGVQTELYPSMKLAVEGKEITCGGETLAEGIAVKKPGGVTLPVVDALVDEILLVNERELEWAVGALIEQQRVVSEGAGAAGIAAIHANPALFAGKKVGVVICGGNIDPRLLASILNRNMAVDGRIARLRIDISDEPGMLAAISTTIGKCGGNIVEIYHQRLFYDVPAKLAKIDAVIETRGPDHVDEIIAALRAAHFQVRQLEDSAT